MWVYPRVCGGTPSQPRQWVAVPGLSPRVRGNRAGTRRRAGSCRSIPACAGEPAIFYLRRSATAVYPRVCGGTEAGQRGRVRQLGLSPRVRGNPGPK